MTTGPLESVSSERRFPVVAAYHVFEHIYHPADWLQQVGRFLEPNGLLHLQVPNAASLTRRLSGDAWAGLVFPHLGIILIASGSVLVCIGTIFWRLAQREQRSLRDRPGAHF